MAGVRIQCPVDSYWHGNDFDRSPCQIKPGRARHNPGRHVTVTISSSIEHDPREHQRQEIFPCSIKCRKYREDNKHASARSVLVPATGPAGPSSAALHGVAAVSDVHCTNSARVPLRSSDATTAKSSASVSMGLDTPRVSTPSVVSMSCSHLHIDVGPMQQHQLLHM